MQIIRNRFVVESDWLLAADQGPLPEGQVIVPLSRWLTQREDLGHHTDAVGVRLGPDDSVEVLAKDLPGLPLVALDSGGFVDGRCYSQARLLRERFGFEGEIRVLGAHPEHLAFLERCGANAFELLEGFDPVQALANFAEIGVHYQPAADSDVDTLRWRVQRNRSRGALDHNEEEWCHGP
jgi:uncharacterized protein (DUF934 family)